MTHEQDTEKIELLVKKHGEKFRRLITGSLAWLNKEEPKWSLEDKIDKDEFIEGLIRRAVPHPDRTDRPDRPKHTDSGDDELDRRRAGQPPWPLGGPLSP